MNLESMCDLHTEREAPSDPGIDQDYVDLYNRHFCDRRREEDIRNPSDSNVLTDETSRIEFRERYARFELTKAMNRRFSDWGERSEYAEEYVIPYVAKTLEDCPR